MKRIGKATDYGRIGSMAELRREREKLRWMIRSSEDVLERDYRQVCGYFTFAHITRVVFSKIENIQALIEGIRNGYHTVYTMFHQAKKEQEK